MKKIILLSDTHNHLPSKIIPYIENADEVWHAGDIGDISLLDPIKKIKPVRAVFGNIDNHIVRAEYPLDNRFEIDGIDFWMTHIGGYPGHYIPRVRKILETQPPAVFICGHSHILRVMRDKTYNNMLVLNPGAAGTHGFHLMKTFLQFEIINGKIENMAAIELGKRGAIEAD